MHFDRDRAERLFMDAAGWDRASSSVESLPGPGSSTNERGSLRVDCLPTSPELRDICLFRYIRTQARAERVEALTILTRELERRAGDFAIPLAHLRVISAYFVYRRGDTSHALELLEAEIPRVQKHPSSGYADYVHIQALVHLGACYESSGNLFQTELCYRQAIRIATRRGLFKRYEVQGSLAKVLWASGQHAEALRIHQDPEARLVARANRELRFLVDSHLSAAKCAVDLKEEKTAEEELDRAETLIERYSELAGVPQGYLLLFRGELLTLRTEVESALDHLTRAVSHFERLEPACHQGAIQAKTSLCHFALFEGDFRLAKTIISKLLDEADQKSCVEARGRLLLLESFLYLTDEPPTSKSFESLVRRLHLINNPALLFHALGNLYTYALEFLNEPEQAFLLARIRNLRPLLKRSCYHDLYRQYVTKRYEYAIENRLARYLQNDLEGEWERIEAEVE